MLNLLLIKLQRLLNKSLKSLLKLQQSRLILLLNKKPKIP